MNTARTMSLSDVCYINMGQSPSSSSYNNVRIGIPFFQGNADFGEIHPKVRYWCNQPIKKAKANDILISVRAPIGDINIANEECCIGRGLAALTIKENIGTYKYLFYALKNKVNALISIGKGSTFKAVNKNDLEDICIIVPSKKEQIHIVIVLDMINKLIFSQKNQINHLNLLVKSRFIEMFGDPKVNIMGWRKSKFGEVGQFIGGYAFKSIDYTEKGVRLVKIANVNKDYLDWMDVDYLPFDYLNKYSSFSLQYGDVVMAMTRPIIKSLSAVKMAKVSNSDVPCLLNQRVGKFVFFNDIISIYFIELCKFSFFKEAVVTHSINSLQPNISSEQVESIEIPIPPLSLQNQFAEFVQQVDKSKFVMQKGLEKLEITYKALMQQYFG